MGRADRARHRRAPADARPFGLPAAARRGAAPALQGLAAARSLRAQLAALAAVRAPLSAPDVAALLALVRPLRGAPPAPAPLAAAAALLLRAHAPAAAAALLAAAAPPLAAGAAAAEDVCALAAIADADRGGEEAVMELGVPEVAAAAAAAARGGPRAARPALQLLALCAARGACPVLVAGAALAVLRDERAPRRDAVAAAAVAVAAFCAGAGAGGDVAGALRARVLDADDLPAFARMALLRAVLDAPCAAGALPELLIAGGGAGGGGGVFEALCALAGGGADAHVRARALDGVVAVVRRVAPRPFAPPQRAQVLALLRARLHEPFPGAAQQARDAVAALLAADAPGPAADRFWRDAALALLDADPRVRGVYAPLARLVPRVRARPLLDARPRWVAAAVGAVVAEATLGKPVADCLEAVWRALRADLAGNIEMLHARAGADVLAALVQPANQALRERTAQHLLPAYFRAADDGLAEVADAMLSALRGPQFAQEARVRGTVAVLSAARKRGVFLASFADEETCVMLRAALRSADEDVRCAALNLLVTSRVSTEPVSQSELSLLLEMLPAALLPSGILSEHSRFRHSMRAFFERLRDCVRAAKGGSGGWWMRLRKEQYGGFRTDEFEERRLGFLASVEHFLHHLCVRLLCSTFPGSTFGRRTNALELLNLLARTLGFTDTILRLMGPEVSAPAITTGILDCMVDDWDRPRVVAFDLGMQFPRPIPGMQSGDDAQMFLDTALPMTCSSRKREVDAGSLMCRFVFRSFTSQEDLGKHLRGIRVPLPIPQHLRVGARTSWSDCLPGAVHKEEYHMGDLEYGHSLIYWIDRKIASSEMSFTDACKDGLFHGPVHVLRFIVQDLNWETNNMSSARLRALRRFSKRLLDIAVQCINIAIAGIALEGAADVVKEIPEILTDDVRQRVSSACFLSVKELCVLLGLMAHHIPFGGKEQVDEECNVGGEEVLGLKDIERIGTIIDFVLRSTRHWGVIDGATEGMQLTCESLLRSASESARFLPTKWVTGVITSATRGETYVLRRSAGIPHYVLAVVRAEGATRQSHAMPILATIASMLLTHVQTADLRIGTRDISGTRTKAEESVAHALNLLRALFLDKNLSNSILRFFADTIKVAVNSFGSASWLIRNSAMALFSGLIRRGVGVPQERKKEAAISSFDPSDGTTALMDGCRRIKGATTYQFFSRYPELYPFFLQHLREAVANFSEADATDHPSLFPVLYLLSSLAPSPGGEDEGSDFRKDCFAELLEHCLHWRSDYVRRAAAAGYLSVIESPADIPQLMATFLRDNLPEEPACVFDYLAEESTTSEQSTRGKILLKQNYLHGELLRILGVLVGTWRVLGKPLKMNTIRALTKHLPAKTWLAHNSEKNPCSITRAAMVLVLNRTIEITADFMNENEQAGDRDNEDILKHMHVLLRMGAETANQCLTHKCNQANKEVLGYETFLRVSADLACIVLSESCKRTIFTMSQCLNGFLNLLNHGSRVVREGAASHLSKFLSLCVEEGEDTATFLRCGPEDIPSLKNLWTCVTNALCSEVEECVLVQYLVLCKCLLAVLKRWSTIGIFEDGGVAKMTIIDVAITATGFLQEDVCIDVHEHSLSLLGLCIGALCKLKYSGKSSNGTSMDDVVHIWIAHIEDACNDDQLTSTRRACSQSIGHSGFEMSSCCHVAGEEYTVRLLLCIFKLLEDDHSDIRKMSALVVSEWLPGCHGKSHCLDVLPAIFVVQNELCGKYGLNQLFLRHLEDTLKFDEASTGKSLSGILQSAVRNEDPSLKPAPARRLKLTVEVSDNPDSDSEGSASGRIFSKEAPNTHSEAVNQMQLAVRSCLLIRKQVQNTSGLRSACADFASSLLKKLEQTPSRLLSKDMHIEEFEMTFASVARLAAVATLLPRSERSSYPCLEELAHKIKRAIRTETAIHPALSIAAQAAADMLLVSDSEVAQTATRVMFLL